MMDALGKNIFTMCSQFGQFAEFHDAHEKADQPFSHENGIEQIKIVQDVVDHGPAEQIVGRVLVEVSHAVDVAKDRVAAEIVLSVAPVAAMDRGNEEAVTDQMAKVRDVVVGADPESCAVFGHDELNCAAPENHRARGGPDPEALLKLGFGDVAVVTVGLQIHVLSADNFADCVDLILVGTGEGHSFDRQVGMHVRCQKILEQDIVGIEHANEATFGGLESITKGLHLATVFVSFDELKSPLAFVNHEVAYRRNSPVSGDVIHHNAFPLGIGLASDAS